MLAVAKQVVNDCTTATLYCAELTDTHTQYTYTMSTNAPIPKPAGEKAVAPASPVMPSAKKDKGKGSSSGATATTVDALTADLNKHVGISDESAASHDADANKPKDPRTLRERVLDSSAEDEFPALDTWLHDQVWSEGGELALHLGGKDSDGYFTSEAELDQALTNIQEAASKVACHASVLRKGPLLKPAEEYNAPANPPAPDASHVSAHVMVRRIPVSAQELMEIRVAVVGNVDAGKSTMLGVLTKGVLDDGRGKARVNLFRHKHEIESGRTSSVGMEIMGYDASGQPISGATQGGKEEAVRKLSWEEVCEKAAKVISFIVSPFALTCSIVARI